MRLKKTKGTIKNSSTQKSERLVALFSKREIKLLFSIIFLKLIYISYKIAHI